MRHFLLALVVILAMGVCCGAVDYNCTAIALQSLDNRHTPPHRTFLFRVAAKARRAVSRLGASLKPATTVTTAAADDCPGQTVLWEGSCHDPREPGACVPCPSGSAKGPDGLCACKEGADYFATFVAGCQPKLQSVIPPPTFTYLTSPIGSTVTARDGQGPDVALFSVQMPYAVTISPFAYMTVTMQCSAGHATFDVQVADDRHAKCGTDVLYQRVQERTGLMVADRQGVQAQTYSSQLTVLLRAADDRGHRICTFAARIHDGHAEDSKEVQIGWWKITPSDSGSSSAHVSSTSTTTDSPAASSSSRSASKSSLSRSRGSSSSDSRDESLSSSAPMPTATVTALSPGAKWLLIVFAVLDCAMVAVVCVLHFVYRHERQKLACLKRGSLRHVPRHEPVTPALSVHIV